MRIEKSTFVLAILPVFLCILVLSGCSGSSGPELRTGWIGTSGANEMVYKYATFRGSEEGTVHVEAGETVVLAYAATVDKGTLTIQVQSPGDETLWETTLMASVDEQQVDVLAPETGTCHILVIGDETGGRFAVSWTVR